MTSETSARESPWKKYMMTTSRRVSSMASMASCTRRARSTFTARPAGVVPGSIGTAAFAQMCWLDCNAESRALGRIRRSSSIDRFRTSLYSQPRSEPVGRDASSRWQHRIRTSCTMSSAIDSL